MQGTRGRCGRVVTRCQQLVIERYAWFIACPGVCRAHEGAVAVCDREGSDVAERWQSFPGWDKSAPPSNASSRSLQVGSIHTHTHTMYQRTLTSLHTSGNREEADNDNTSQMSGNGSSQTLHSSNDKRLLTQFAYEEYCNFVVLQLSYCGLTISKGRAK